MQRDATRSEVTRRADESMGLPCLAVDTTKPTIGRGCQHVSQALPCRVIVRLLIYDHDPCDCL